jgi:hypothetical protein
MLIGESFAPTTLASPTFRLHPSAAASLSRASASAAGRFHRWRPSSLQATCAIGQLRPVWR